MAALEEIPAEVSAAGLRAYLPLYLALQEPGALGPGPHPSVPVDGAYVATVERDDTAKKADPPRFARDHDTPADGLRVWPAAVWNGQQAIGPSSVVEAASTREPEADRLARLLLATVAALSNPLWVRRVVPSLAPESVVPTAPRRARKRGDPRAQPYEVLRLAPTPDPHVVRYREPVVGTSPVPSTQRRRVGQGIVLGAPMAEHDVRPHRRRIVTTEDRAMERDDWIVTELLPVRPGAPAQCVVLVPVRPHVRGKGPRRDVLIRGKG